MFSNIGLDRWHVANKHIYNYNFCVFLCVLTDFDVLYLNLLVLYNICLFLKTQLHEDCVFYLWEIQVGLFDLLLIYSYVVVALRWQ